MFRKDWRINLAFWWYTDILNYPKTGSLAKNHFWFVATQKERSVLIIQMLFSWFSCGSDQWLSASTKFLCVVFLILKFFFCRLSFSSDEKKWKLLVLYSRIWKKILAVITPHSTKPWLHFIFLLSQFILCFTITKI